MDYIGSMNRSIYLLFRDILKGLLGRPGMLIFSLKMLLRQRKAARRRAYWEKQGVHVPPYMIVSVTGRCNLRCKGCYAKAQGRLSGDEMDDTTLRRVLSEARDLGVSIVIVAGGEPLMRQNLLDITADFPEMIFAVFTNGLLVDDGIIKKLSSQKHTVPVFSLEGYEAETDFRRGAGVYHSLRQTMKKIGRQSLFWGISLTVTNRNMETVSDPGFIEELVALGSKAVFFIEYIPVAEGSEGLVPDQAQKQELLKRAESYRRRFAAVFTVFPGDEEQYGGCLSAGRGFIHVDPAGRVEPCPFAPYSDANLASVSLKEALSSKFLEAIRANHAKLSESGGGCALWTNREWVRSLLDKTR